MNRAGLILSLSVLICVTAGLMTGANGAPSEELRHDILYSSRHYVQRGQSHYQIRRLSPRE